MEVGEGAQEGAGEIADAEVEPVDEGKAPVASEIPDSSASPSTGVAEAVPTATAVESLTVIAPPATAISVARKRALPVQEIAPSDDELIPQDSKSEKAPPHKKSRPAEVSSCSALSIGTWFLWIIVIPNQPSSSISSVSTILFDVRVWWPTFHWYYDFLKMYQIMSEKH
jgi:hypothetical protein